MAADNSGSSLAINTLMRCLLVVIIRDSIIVAAQQHDFANEGRDAVKPGLCPRPEEVDSQDLSSNCKYDVDCPSTKKCCKAITGAMLCLKAVSTVGCNVRGDKILQKGESVIVDCYNCTCLNGSTLMCLSYNCTEGHRGTTSNSGSCPKVVDPGECFSHQPCQQDSQCSGGQKCCNVQCGIPICISGLVHLPEIGLGCSIGDKHYSSGQRSNVSDSQLDCFNCLCRSDGNWHCQRHLCRTKLSPSTGRARSVDFLVWLLLLPFIASLSLLH